MAAVQAATIKAHVTSDMREPWRSKMGPINGATNAPTKPPSETAPEIPVRDHPNSAVIGTKKTDNVATAAACRAIADPITQLTMTQP